MLVILATREAEIRMIKVLSQKYPTVKRTGEVTQVIECLTSKHEALNSNPTTKQ
jgi:hypothetical protein